MTDLGSGARMACSAAALLWTAPALAQETGNAPPPAAPSSANVEGSRTYTPEDFTRFAPRTALEMVRQVPGFTILNVDQERGLGEASGNVLINGQRISGKSNNPVTELERISAKNVVRIDIVDGATLNIAGLSGQVANVIVNATGMKGQFEYRAEVRARNTDPLFSRGNVSVSGEIGPIAYTIGLRNDASRGGASGPTYIYDGFGILTDLRQEIFTSNVDQPKISGSFKYEGPGSEVGNLSLSGQLFRYTFHERSDRSGSGQVDRVRNLRDTEREHNYEISGDYEWPLGPGRLKLIGLKSFEHSPFTSTAIIDFADERPSTGSRFRQVADENETIGRVEYRLKNGRSDWQVSGEAAFNVLDVTSVVGTLAATGAFVEAPLPGGTAKVSEDRYEANVTYGRTLTAKLSVQASAGAEYSQLSQSGELGKARQFVRPKGFVSAAWKPVPTLDVNAKLERRVGQLNFFDFIASVNLNSGTADESNPDLVPPQSWEAELQAVKNWGDWGTSTLRLYSRLIGDIVDQIPIGETSEATGNLDRATVAGFDWKNTLQLGPAGWKGARLDTRLQLQRTRLEDPLTGLSRPISGNTIRLAEAALRYDVPDSDWAFGANGSHVEPAKTFRLSQLVYSNEGPVFASVFAENKDVLGLTVRGTVGNLLGANSVLDRIAYVGRRTGPVSFVEARRRTIGPVFTLFVSGSF